MLDLIESHCNRCGQETNHHVRAKHRRNGAVDVNDPDTGDVTGEINWWEQCEIVQCAGCDLVSFRKIAFNDDDGETSIRLYPPKSSRRKPRWLPKVPNDIGTLLRQTYQALDGDSRALAMMGARAVADMLIVDQVGDVGPFHKKLNAMEAKGHLTSANREVLEAALDAGSAAAHRGHQPSIRDVEAVMDILENLLQAKYYLEPLAAGLRRRTPPRQPKALTSHVRPVE